MAKKALKKQAQADTVKIDAPVKKKSRLRENVEAIIIAVIVALFIRAFIVQAFKIPSGSMEDTLLVGDHLLVNKFIYGIKVPFTDKKLVEFSEPKVGDIIVFKYPVNEKIDFIKRVVAVAGDTVEIRNKQLFVNGQPVFTPKAHNKDPHIASDPRGYPVFNPQDPARFFSYKDQQALDARRDNMPPVVVPPGTVFAMGDNRDESADSRFWGFVEIPKIKGKALIIYWSWDSEAKFPRFSRIADILR